jgi:hypothetical protein
MEFRNPCLWVASKACNLQTSFACLSHDGQSQNALMPRGQGQGRGDNDVNLVS